MTAHKMTFADEYVYDILDGNKTATVRLGWDDLSASDYLLLVDESGDQFARADIEAIANTTAREALNSVAIMDAKHGANTTARLVEGLNRHYEQEVTPETDVSVVVFSVRDAEQEDGPEVRRR